MTLPRPQRRNANKHSPRGMAALEHSIQQDGWIGAITVAADGETFDGSARIETAAATGFDNPLVVETDGSRPVVLKRVDIPTADDPRAVRLGLAANRVAQTNLEWDTSVLAELGESIDLSQFWTREELADLLVKDVEPGNGGDDFDATPDEGPTRVQPGELWQLGEHRLLCGDSTKAEDVARLMDGERAVLLATDPPYNVGIDYGEESDDSKLDEVYETFTRSWMSAWQDVSDRQVVSPGCYNLARWCRWFDPYHVAPWTKTNAMTNGKVSRWWCWEPVLFFGDKWKRTRSNDVFEFNVAPQSAVGIGSLSGLHPCPKPVAMWIDLMENYSDPGDIVADAFGGSGTTIIAAHRTKRKAYICEIEPKYADLCLRRFEAETGIAPVLVDA